MFSFNRIEDLLKKNNSNAKTLADAIGVSSGNVYDWKSGKAKPGAEALRKIADYFDVSTDYLLGRTDDPNMAVVDMESISKHFRKAFNKEDLEILEVAKEAVEDGLTAADLREILRTFRFLKKR